MLDRYKQQQQQKNKQPKPPQKTGCRSFQQPSHVCLVIDFKLFAQVCSQSSSNFIFYSAEHYL